MNHGRLDLLPPIYGARARIRLANRRILLCSLGVAALLVALVFHARINSAGADDRLAMARDRAEMVIAAEAMETRLLDEMEQSRQRIEQWRRVALPLPVGKVLMTMSNVVPPEIRLDQLHIDITGIRSSYRRDQGTNKRMICHFEGMAPDEQTVRLLVDRLRSREPFDEVRRGFTALDEDDQGVMTRFSVSFEIDLMKPACVVMGGEDQ